MSLDSRSIDVLKAADDFTDSDIIPWNNYKLSLPLIEKSLASALSRTEGEQKKGKKGDVGSETIY